MLTDRATALCALRNAALLAVLLGGVLPSCVAQPACEQDALNVSVELSCETGGVVATNVTKVGTMHRYALEGDGQSVTLSTCGSAIETALSATLCPAEPGDPLAERFDGGVDCANGRGRELTFTPPPGETYFVLVEGVGASEGEFELRLTAGCPMLSLPSPSGPRPDPPLHVTLVIATNASNFVQMDFERLVLDLLGLADPSRVQVVGVEAVEWVNVSSAFRVTASLWVAAPSRVSEVRAAVLDYSLRISIWQGVAVLDAAITPGEMAPQPPPPSPPLRTDERPPRSPPPDVSGPRLYLSTIGGGGAGACFGIALLLFAAWRLVRYSRKWLADKETIELALESNKSFKFPMYLVRATDFVRMRELLAYETVRDKSQHVVVDFVEEARDRFSNPACRNKLIFISHREPLGSTPADACRCDARARGRHAAPWLIIRIPPSRVCARRVAELRPPGPQQGADSRDDSGGQAYRAA
jgi:hypothetical protein